MKFIIKAITLLSVCFTPLISLSAYSASKTSGTKQTPKSPTELQEEARFDDMAKVHLFSDERDASLSYTYIRAGGGVPSIFVPAPTFSGGIGRRIVIGNNALDLSVNGANASKLLASINAQMGYLRYFGNEDHAIYLGASAGPAVVIRNYEGDYLFTPGTIFPAANFLLGFEVRRNGKAVSFSQVAFTPIGLGTYFSFGVGF